MLGTLGTRSNVNDIHISFVSNLLAGDVVFNSIYMYNLMNKVQMLQLNYNRGGGSSEILGGGTIN